MENYKSVKQPILQRGKRECFCLYLLMLISFLKKNRLPGSKLDLNIIQFNILFHSNMCNIHQSLGAVVIPSHITKLCFTMPKATDKVELLRWHFLTGQLLTDRLHKHGKIWMSQIHCVRRLCGHRVTFPHSFTPGDKTVPADRSIRPEIGGSSWVWLMDRGCEITTAEWQLPTRKDLVVKLVVVKWSKKYKGVCDYLTIRWKHWPRYLLRY